MNIPLEQQGVRSSGVKRTDIEWADCSVNPVRARLKDDPTVVGTACTKVGEGCRNCYAETLNQRFGTGLGFTAQDDKKVEWWLDDSVLQHMLTFRPRGPFKNGRERPAVFLGDMTDVFNERVPDEWLDRLFAVFALRPDVDWLVLSKRPARMVEYMKRVGLSDIGPRGHLCPVWPAVLNRAEQSWIEANNDRYMLTVRPVLMERARRLQDKPLPDGPLPNVWLGCSVWDQASADKFIPDLLRVPAAVRFVSYEPALESVDFMHWLYPDPPSTCGPGRFSILDWLIVGGESGPCARQMDIQWARFAVLQCRNADVPVFVKQLGSSPVDRVGGVVVWPETGLRSRKGADMAEWPEDLRVREMPGGERATINEQPTTPTKEPAQ